MDTSIVVATITASGSILVAALTFYLTKRHQFNVEWQNQKLNHYKVLLSAISDAAVGDAKAVYHFALATNTIALVGSQAVIQALMAFHAGVEPSNPDRSPVRENELLRKLLLDIRKDIGLSKNDNPETFVFHLVGGALSKGR